MKENEKSKSLAVQVANSISDNDRFHVLYWMQDLLVIRKSDLSNLDKTKQAFLVTQKRKIIFPIITILYKQTKKFLWDDRTIKGRLGTIGMGAGVAFFSGQSAGLAALGGAIGVPLWIVLGAGGTFAGYLIEEIQKKNLNKHSDTIIDLGSYDSYSQTNDKITDE